MGRGSGVLSVTLDGGAGSAEGPVGATETVVISKDDGTQIRKKVVGLTSGTKQLSFTGLPSGTLHLHVGLSASAGGVETGAVDTTFEGGVAARPVIVKMRQPVVAVSMPSVASVNVGSTVPLYAAARAGDGSYVFTAANGWSWTSGSSANATVDGSGKVTGVAAGNATITATHLASGANASTAVSVLSNAVTQGKWTIMVYMDAANDLWPNAADNINQMEGIAKGSDVRFVVQWKQVQGLAGNTNPLFSGTRRYLVAPDSTSAVKSTVVQDLGSNVDMASSDSLRDFVTWTKAKYPADHYALVLWSHGDGWYSTKTLARTLKSRAVIYDDDSGNELNLPDIRNALDPGSLDILAYDACLMQGVESLAEFADRAKFIVGSEDETPAPGFPYHRIFGPFVDAPDTSTNVLATGIASTFVDYYKDNPQVLTPIHMSALDTSKAAGILGALDGLAQALTNEAPAVGTAVRNVRLASTRIEPSVGRYYYDLDQIASGFGSDTSLSPSIRSAAEALDAALSGAVIANFGGNGARSAPSYHGMSVEFARSGVIGATSSNGGYAAGYGHLQLSSLTHWNEFLESSTANP